jgi:hypothetical protein
VAKGFSPRFLPNVQAAPAFAALRYGVLPRLLGWAGFPAAYFVGPPGRRSNLKDDSVGASEGAADV